MKVSVKYVQVCLYVYRIVMELCWRHSIIETTQIVAVYTEMDNGSTLIQIERL